MGTATGSRSLSVYATHAPEWSQSKLHTAHMGPLWYQPLTHSHSCRAGVSRVRWRNGRGAMTEGPATLRLPTPHLHSVGCHLLDILRVGHVPEATTRPGDRGPYAHNRGYAGHSHSKSD